MQTMPSSYIQDSLYILILTQKIKRFDSKKPLQRYLKLSAFIL